jgi:hypothetical protein
MKILYKCEKCGYETDRLLNYKRHEQRKTPCYIKLEDSVDKINTAEKVGGTAEKVGVTAEKVGVTAEKVGVTAEKVGVTAEKVGVNFDEKIQCNKCNKVFTRIFSKNKHEEKCDGLDKRQCKICLKVFASKFGKYEHTKYVKCNPPSTQQIINNNNITNNINTNCNNNITNNINIVRVNFGEESLVKICQGKEYIKKAQKFVDSGKYAISSSIEEIYFNDNSVENQTIKKNRRNDKLVSIMINGKWETRMFDDVSKIIMKTTEDYFNPFFIELQDKYDDIIQAKDGRKLMQLMAPIWRLATYITQHMGWNCKEIRKLGLNIDYDDDLDKEDLQRQTQRIKDVYTLILDKLHDKTLEIKSE